jgi:hypothetical protein
VNWDAVILMALKILAVLALVLLNGFFVAAEFALVRIRETQLDVLVAKGWRRAKMALHIVRNLNSYLSATQLGITMASLGLGWIGQPVFTTLLEPLLIPLGVVSDAWLHSISFAVGFSALTFLHITVGELAPKWMTIQKPLPVALGAAYPLRWFYLAFYPFNRLLNYAARWLLERIGIEPDGAVDRAQSEEELRLLVTSAQAAVGGRNIILNALDLRHRVAREVMRPRHEIAAFDTERPGRMPRAGGKDALLALSALRGRRFGQNARRRAHQRPLSRGAGPGCGGTDGGGFAAGGAPVDLRAGNRAPRKAAPVVSRTKIALRHCRGRIRRHHRHRHARKRARSARRPDSGRVRPGKIGIDARERKCLGGRRDAAVA